MAVTFEDCILCFQDWSSVSCTLWIAEKEERMRGGCQDQSEAETQDYFIDKVFIN
jgi:hypothetical protein